MIKNQIRIIFLKKFTEAMIREKVKESQTKHNIEVGKIKQKFVPEQVFKDFIRSPYEIKIMQKPTTRPIQPLRQMQIKQIKPILANPIATKPVTNTSGMEKISSLINDRTIQLIECPGPGKNLLIKRYNQVNLTKIILSQEDITQIINDFADKARIPIINGILKAGVGNLIISAIISNFVGSRFIINKVTPYTLIQ